MPEYDAEAQDIGIIWYEGEGEGEGEDAPCFLLQLTNLNRSSPLLARGFPADFLYQILTVNPGNSGKRTKETTQVIPLLCAS